MKGIKLLCGLMLLAGISASGLAQADHRHGHVRSHVDLVFSFGAPYAYSYYPYPYYVYPYYPYPYYSYPYYPPVVEVPVPTQPPVYLEQGGPQQGAAPYAGNYWYRCHNPDGYYPYIKKCPGGWEKVVPTPPPEQ